jgi:3-hydroxyisobutyrate dehydrogenase-like beta-hydroxyacid dehydrogenase
MRIAFIGLGAMGLPMAERLAAAGGIELTLFDVARDRLEQAAGLGRLARSVSDAARGADAVFAVLPADPHVESVAAELESAAHPGLVFADFSTIAPGTIERVAGRLAQLGMQTVSVAVTRGTAAARAGELALFVGTDGVLPESLRAPLEAVATEIRAVGGLGAAKVLKIANNMVVACIDVAICEALVLGGKLGLPAEVVTSRLPEEGADSWALRNHIVKHVLPDDLGPGGFSTEHMAKDIRLFVDLAAEQGQAAPLAGVVSACYRGTIAAGYGGDYHPVVIRWLEQGAGCGPVKPGGGRPLADEDRRRLHVICRGVLAVQRLASLGALALAAGAGIAPSEAGRHLASGSAANDSLAEAVAHLDGGARLPREALAGELRETVDLAAAAGVPALTFETARHVALGLDG